MHPISDMPDDDFMKLRELYGADLPICPICTLDATRSVLNEAVYEAPKSAVSEGVRQTLEKLLFAVTGALVSDRTEAELEDQASH